MECPKCGSKSIFYIKRNKVVNAHGVFKHIKRYTCTECGCNFDFDINGDSISMYDSLKYWR